MISNFFSSWYPSYFLISSVFMAILAIISYKYRNNLIAKYFVILLILNSCQSFLSVLEVTSENLYLMLLFRNLQQIPLFSYPIVLFLCVLDYIGKRIIIDKYLFYICLPTVIYLFLIFTDQFHHLMRVNIDINYLLGISRLSITSTQFSKYFINYGYVLLYISLLLLLLNLRKNTRYDRIQNVIMILVIVFLLGQNYVVSQLNLKYLDFKAIVYIPLGLVILIGVKKHQLFSIFPIAKDLVIENMKDGMIVLDNDYKIVDFNIVAQEMVYTLFQINIHEDKVASKRAMDLLELFEKTNKSKFDFTGEYKNKVRELEIKISYIQDKRGEKLGYLFGIHDVTEYKKMQRQLETSQRERLEFLSNISHDIRNPLTSIIGFSNAILNGKIPTSDRKYIQYIYDRSQHINSLVNDLLELTKLEARSVQFKCKDENAKDIFMRLCQGYFEEIEATGKTFSYQINTSDTEIYVDKIRIEQVVNNLVSNAMNHTREGDSIHIQVSQLEEEVKVEVTDTGSGVTIEEQATIFERYYTNQIKPTSHGLGLAICKEIIGIHNGEIGVKSEGEKGCTFYFTVPISKQVVKNF